MVNFAPKYVAVGVGVGNDFLIPFFDKVKFGKAIKMNFIISKNFHDLIFSLGVDF